MSDLLGEKGWTFPYFRKPMVLKKSLCQVNQSAQWRKLLMYLFYKTNKKKQPCGFLKKSSKIVASNLLIDNKNHELRCN